ncbi:TIGR00180 family glycosyltransferase [Pseudomonas baltica]|uniref:TIGR00180 family glycosyltransferase n=1 Tax=Pseudomonas baltica TaxID=2762576 RepID=UPI00289DFB70|nr:TIGR00180 family glycosyltransferase [Pseudomonas baltica]
MPNLPVSEHSPALHGRLTLVLLTHNRPAFVRRALQYYAALDCQVLVVDSSTTSNAEIAGQFPDADYHYVPQFSYRALAAKLKYAVQQVETPFMVFAADDDFALHDGLASALTFLEQHPDYGLCHGYSLMYQAQADAVSYYRRDRKVQEDYAYDSGRARALAYMGQYLPTLYAVTRTGLIRDWLAQVADDISFEWLEISQVFWLLASAKARVLPIPYVVRELNYLQSEHGSDVLGVLRRPDQTSVAAREAFAERLANVPSFAEHDPAQRHGAVLDCFDAMSECLSSGRSLGLELIVESRWKDAFKPPQRLFEPTQYVEMPFYNQAFFDQLTAIEFLIHAKPAGRLQLAQLEGVWTRQEMLLKGHANDVAETVIERLWKAMDYSVFNRRVVEQLVLRLSEVDETEACELLQAWAERLHSVDIRDNLETFASMPSGRLMSWLEARSPAPAQGQAITQYLQSQAATPQIGILLLDLDNDMEKLQVTLDSLVEGHYTAFKITVFTTGEPPVATTVLNTLHFVKVTKALYIDKLNQIARQSSCDWLILAEVGDQFTTAGLARAALELLKAPECRAVAADEIHRQHDGSLKAVFRPGFNLDLLQSVPALMARHWLIRRDVLVGAGGYSANFSQALEFDLLLRIIETGGMGWLAHLDEPLLICSAVPLEENVHERQTLIRHLTTRGYQAAVTSESPGTYRIDYRHSARPLVSVILPCQDNLAQLQATLESLRLRTRYNRYEVLVVDNASQGPDMLHWLDHNTQPAGRVRVLKSEQPISLAALYNAASQQAQGEFLVLLDSAAEVVNPNWIESLLNHALRPEVGVVGAKLIDASGQVTQAGLILSQRAGVLPAFSGAANGDHGYLQRLIVDQNYSAVSATCLMIGKALFESVGGLEDNLFASALSDVDLCLKVSQAGQLIVWTPYVQVVYPGSVAQPAQTLFSLQRKWPGNFAHDLAYNQNLSQLGGSFALGDAAAIDWAPLLG